MVDREKLIELIDEAAELYPSELETIADHLIANGVTVTDNNVGGKCDYCQEDREGYRKMLGTFSIRNPFHGNEWYIHTGHLTSGNIYFCPMCGRKLAEPPKGE